MVILNLSIKLRIPMVIQILLVSTLFNDCTASDPPVPADFPGSIKLDLKPFTNWGEDYTVEKVWMGDVSSVEEILEAVNWARSSQYKIRASGYQHTWAPITVSHFDVPSATSGSGSSSNSSEDKIPKVILLKTQLMDKMTVISNKTGDSSFWAETGITLEKLTQVLEQNNLSLAHHPATGNITLGGMIAIGAHGAAVHTKNAEPLAPGHSYGSLSNLIISFTAIVYDPKLNSYTLRTFNRSEKDSKYFLVNLGRTFLTNVTMRVGPLIYMQCFCDYRIPGSELFGPPLPMSDPVAPSNSVVVTNRFVDYLKLSGRTEVIVFPYSNLSWLKNWFVLNETINKTDGSRGRFVKRPYNYAFSDHPPPEVTTIIHEIKKGNYSLAQKLGLVMWNVASNATQNSTTTLGHFVSASGFDSKPNNNGTSLNGSICGSARSVLLYIKPSTLRATANGYGVLIGQDDMQKFLNYFYAGYNNIRDKYSSQDKYPFNGILEVRASGLDDPTDVSIDGAEPPSIGLGTRPGGEKGKNFDTIVWINILCFANTPDRLDAMIDIENLLLEIVTRPNMTVLIRPEYSKGYGYTKSSSWSSDPFLINYVPNTFSNSWQETVSVLNKFDPYHVFSNTFLDHFMS